MHTRHFVAWGFLLGLGALFIPACAVAVDNAESEAEEVTMQVQKKDEAPIDVTARFMCKGLNVVECMIRCADQGTACKPTQKHPKKPGAGYGDLYACRTSAPRSSSRRSSSKPTSRMRPR